MLGDFGNSRTLLAEVIAVFVTETPARLEAVRTAAASNDARALGAAAHVLKGSVGLFSMGPAYEAARALELAARTGDVGSVGRLVADVERESVRVLADLQALLEKL